MPNATGMVKEAAIITTKYQGIPEKHAFLVADIGEDDIILGYPFLEATNPWIDWKKADIGGTLLLLAQEAKIRTVLAMEELI